jgi:hypothetical protein
MEGSTLMSQLRQSGWTRFHLSSDFLFHAGPQQMADARLYWAEPSALQFYQFKC